MTPPTPTAAERLTAIRSLLGAYISRCPVHARDDHDESQCSLCQAYRLTALATPAAPDISYEDLAAAPSPPPEEWSQEDWSKTPAEQQPAPASLPLPDSPWHTLLAIAGGLGDFAIGFVEGDPARPVATIGYYSDRPINCEGLLPVETPERRAAIQALIAESMSNMHNGGHGLLRDSESAPPAELAVLQEECRECRKSLDMAMKENKELETALGLADWSRTPAEQQCPDCDGSGKSNWVLTHAKPVDGFNPTLSHLQELARDAQKCSFCCGSGKINPEQIEWRHIGEQWRKVRLELGVGMREWAERAGCLPSDYCAMESGRRRPEPRFAPNETRRDSTPVSPSVEQSPGDTGVNPCPSPGTLSPPAPASLPLPDKPIKTSFTNPAPAMYCSLYGAFKEKAVELGYALAVHGSMQRDFDLIAVPWTHEAASAETLVESLREICGGFIIEDGTPGGRYDAEQGKFVPATVKNPDVKPHGRLAWNIHLGGRPSIDLSVMPKAAPPAEIAAPPLWRDIARAALAAGGNDGE